MVRNPALPLFAFVIALGLGACGAVRWHKVDGDDSALARDLGACHKQVQDRFGTAGRVGPLAPTDPRFGPPPSQADQRMQEAQAVGNCMRGKGYSLVPDKN
jgi:hypothetical protein